MPKVIKLPKKSKSTICEKSIHNIMVSRATIGKKKKKKKKNPKNKPEKNLNSVFENSSDSGSDYY